MNVTELIMRLRKVEDKSKEVMLPGDFDIVDLSEKDDRLLIIGF